MPELIAIQTEEYDFVVWSRDVAQSQKRLARTLEYRGNEASSSRLLIAPAVRLKSGEELGDYDVGQPVFFENKQYDIEFVFEDLLKNTFAQNPPLVRHRLKAVESAFHYSVRSNSLRATINTGNHVGWFRFELVYNIEGKESRHSFSFEILPTKMDMGSDLAVMNAAIDEEFPLWRFSLAEKTQHQMRSVKKPHPQFLLLWLAQFEALLGDMQSGLKHIVNAPHSRLISTTRTVKMDRLKGKLSRNLEQSVMRAKADGDLDKRFKVINKKLSVDTPENRFIKAVVSVCISKLTKIDLAARNMQTKPEKQRLSDSFFSKLDLWRQDIRFFQRHPLFDEVGSFNGLRRESLVLQQKPGYAKVYKVWQQLKWYLDILEGDANLSLRSVAELYEIWCFLEVRRILLALDFEEVSNSRIPMLNSGIDVSFKDGMRGTFKLKRKDGVSLRLAHEPRFLPNGDKIKSWITTQKPDIFLEASFPNGEKVVWLFDAKYRINAPREFEGIEVDGLDYVPDDAINQMHRYRDALIQQDDDEGQISKTRPVFGAYALYPGFYDQHNDENPYAEAIDEVGIGAFSLLPLGDHSGSIWLSNFLTEKLDIAPESYSLSMPDKYFVEEAPRIPYYGTKITRYQDLVIAANQLGPSRDKDYVTGFSLGRASFYHTKQLAFERQRIEYHVVNEAQYLAVATEPEKGGGREIGFVYPILSSKKVHRSEITFEQSGSNFIENPAEPYWLFELGKSLKISQKVVLDADPHFKLKLVSIEALSSNIKWDDLEERYTAGN
ncbi:MAG: hypothetical protein ACI9SP_003267 [Arenicella sp.]|jgi:hypothetical protein